MHRSRGSKPSNASDRRWKSLRVFLTCSQARFTHACLCARSQWLGFQEPDPAGVHYNAVLRAASLLIQKFRLDEDNMYIWIEYATDPQAGPSRSATTRFLLPTLSLAPNPVPAQFLPTPTPTLCMRFVVQSNPAVQ